MNQRANEVVKAIPLGGHGEIGKNSWILEYNDEIVIVNYGSMLPPKDVQGVDLVLPNISYLLEHKSKIKGLILTSAHDDSCGGVFYLLERIAIPKIWGSKLAIESISLELPEGVNFPEHEIIEARKEFKVGSISFTPLSNTYILPDTYGLNIKTPAGSILYTGSYKIDQTPLDKVLLDYYSYSQAGETGVDVFISDSANIETTGYCQSEKVVTKRFDDIFRDSSSRIIIVGYANNLFKYQIIFDLAKKYKKKIFLSGEHLNNKIKAAIKTGFFTIDKTVLVQKKDLKEVKDSEYVAIVSGKYGDFLSALTDIAKKEHKDITLKPKDTMVISANPPPGSVRTIAHTVDQLFIQKIQVIGGRGQGVHVAEHASQEETKFMLTIAKPRSFVPSHGEERQLVLHEAFAEAIGTNHNDIHIIKNGEILTLTDGVSKVKGKIPAESIYYNQAKKIDIFESTMRERQFLSEEGTVTIALTVDKENNIIAGPEVLAEGCSFAKGKDWRAFCLGTKELIKEAIKTYKETDQKSDKDVKPLKSVIKDTVNRSVLELIGKRPLISVTMQEVDLSSVN